MRLNGRIGSGAKLVPLLAALLLGALAAPAIAALPDGRGYELVSPSDKLGNDVIADPIFGADYGPAASNDGNKVTFTSYGAFGDSVANGVFNTYLATRGGSGWSTHALSPPQNAVNTLSTSFFQGFTDDLSQFVVMGPFDPQPAAGASQGTQNLFVRDASGTYHLVSVGTPANDQSFQPSYRDGADDLSHVVFSSPEDLTGEAPGIIPLLYDWSASSGDITLVGRMPGSNAVSPDPVDIAAPPGLFSGPFSPFHPVSADGSKIFFYTPNNGSQQQIYVRIGGTSTQQVSASHATSADPNGTQTPTFWFASVDGSRAFFTSAEKLTDDATTGATDSGSDLYRYDVGSDSLTDITVDGSDTNGAQVQNVLGGSDDGTKLYFVAQGVLAAGATAGQNNLYLWTDDGSQKGSISFIAGPVDSTKAYVTPDGMHLAFESTSSLTGYDSAGHLEVFSYGAGTNALACASCNPSGDPGTSDASISGNAGAAQRAARAVSNDGSKVFFTSADALVTKDTNGEPDTYEFEPATGDVALISGGTSSEPSEFQDASPSGNDVFFTTRQRLVGSDTDGNMDVYDARVGGGFPESAPPGQCSGESCKPPPTTPPQPTFAATVTFFGLGNLPGSNGTKPRVKLRVATRTVHGSKFRLRLNLPGRGKVVLTGKDLIRVSRITGHGGSFTLVARLKKSARGRLHKRKTLKTVVHVRYQPAGGSVTRATFRLTVKA
jgi:WD40 repeat protein